MRKVSWPSMCTRPEARRTWIRSAAEPSAPSTTGPMRPGPSVGPTTTAPAPSPNSAAVRRSSGSTKRDIRSAPITSTWSALPASTWPAASASAGEEAAARGAHVERAGGGRRRGHAPRAGRRWAAGRPGSSWPRPRGRGRRGRAPARRSASRPGRRGEVREASPRAPATRRSRMPVRLKIQSSVTPSRSAIAPLATTVSGRLAPTDAMPAAAGGLERAVEQRLAWRVSVVAVTGARFPRGGAGRHLIASPVPPAGGTFPPLGGMPAQRLRTLE